MALYAEVRDSIVAQIVELPEGVTIDQAVHADLVAAFHSCAPEVQPGWHWAAGSFSAPSEPGPATIDLIAYAADKRWQLEIGGIMVAGQAIDTSRASQSMIAGADALAQIDPDETVEFKAASGWVTLDAAFLHAIALAVGRHVRGLFRREREIVEAIDAGTITSTAEVDAAFAD